MKYLHKIKKMKYDEEYRYGDHTIFKAMDPSMIVMFFDLYSDLTELSIKNAKRKNVNLPWWIYDLLQELQSMQDIIRDKKRDTVNKLIAEEEKSKSPNEPNVEINTKLH